MKILFRTTLLLLLIISLAACKTKRLSTAAEYRQFYNSINKEYDDAIAFTQHGVDIKQKEQNTKQKKKMLVNEKDSFYFYISEMTKDIRELKSLTSEILKNESANKSNNVAVQPSQQPVAAVPSVPSVPLMSSPIPPSRPVVAEKPKDEKAIDSKVFRKGKFTLVDQADAHLLKKYNVVIATLSTIPRTEFVKAALKESDPEEVVIVVKNSRGQYYVIQGSYDSQSEALGKRQSIISDYTKRYSRSALMKKYGIPFSDTWIVYDEN